MLKVDVISGFLGAGKTTLIKKLLSSAYVGQKVVLIENEFGEIGIDGGFLKEAGIEISEINSGCICCSLVGDFSKALQKVAAEFSPDRIIIEPSGVGKLSDVEKAIMNSGLQDAVIGTKTTVVDASKCKVYHKNFGEFYVDQIAAADCVILSHAESVSEEKLNFAIDLIRGINAECVLVTTPYQTLDGEKLFAAMTKENTLAHHIESTLAEAKRHHHDDDDEDEHEHHHHHHHHDGEECDDPECECHHHHHDDDDEDEHEHHHHHHHHDGEECDDPECECHHHHHDDDDEDEHEHHHHHHHHDGEECDDPECECHHHHHDDDDEDEHEHHHHHHHHADEAFESIGLETAATFTKEKLNDILNALNDREKYGFVLRAKGIVNGESEWIYFDFVPEFIDIRTGAPDVIGKICVIGHDVKRDAVKALFKNA